MGTMKLSRLGIVMLTVADLDLATRFYRDTLGLAFRFGSGEFAFFDAGVTVCLRHSPQRPGPVGHEGVELVFTVSDIDAAFESLQSRGVQFRVEPRIVTGDQLAADFRDPDGHVLSIFGPRAATAGPAGP